MIDTCLSIVAIDPCDAHHMRVSGKRFSQPGTQSQVERPKRVIGRYLAHFREATCKLPHCGNCLPPFEARIVDHRSIEGTHRSGSLYDDADAGCRATHREFIDK